MQSLKLGETLDDGTTLNQYSQALASVGVNIKDGNGELKTMDTILDETMAKWGKLSADQRVALAQSVAGVRQYNQFISLMSNADFFKENVERAKDATGTLNEQNAIYAESWEAASKRVKTSIQGIYDDIIDDKWLIEATNNLATFISGIDKFIESIGGLKTIVPSIGGILLTLFANKIPDAINSITYNFRVLTGEAYKDATKIYTEMRQLVDKAVTENNGLAESQKQEFQNTSDILKVQEKIAASQKDLTEEEKKQAEQILEKLKLQQQYLLTLQKQKGVLAERAEKAKTEAHKAVNNVTEKDYVENTVGMAKSESNYESTIAEINAEAKFSSPEDRELTQALADVVIANLNETTKKIEQAAKDEQAKIKVIIENYLAEFNNAADEVKEKGFSDFVKSKGLPTEELFGTRIKALEGVRSRSLDSDMDKKGTLAELRTLASQIPGLADEIPLSEENVANVDALNKTIDEIINKVIKLGVVSEKAEEQEQKRIGGILQDLGTTDQKLGNLQKKAEEAAEAEKNLSGNAKAIEEAKAAIKSYVTEAESAATHTAKFSEVIGTSVGAVTMLGTGLQTLVGGFKLLSNDSATTTDKIIGFITALGSGIGMISSAATSVGKLAKKIEEAQAAAMALESAKWLQSLQGVSDQDKGVLAEALKKNKGSGKTDSDALKGLLNTTGNGLSEAGAKVIKESLDGGGLKDSIDLVEIFKTKLGSIKGTAKATGKGIANFGKLAANVLTKLPPQAIAATIAIAAIGVAAYLTYKKIKENSPEERLKRATAALKDAEAAADEANSKFNEFNNLVSDYSTAKNGLDSLTKGTKEYADQVDKANDAARELLKIYPELASAWKMVNGVITFDEAALDKIEAEKKKTKVQSAANASRIQLEVDTAQAEVDLKKLRFMGEKTIYNTEYGVDQQYAWDVNNKGLVSSITNNESYDEILAALSGIDASNEESVNGALEVIKNAGIKLDDYALEELETQKAYLEKNGKTLAEYLEKYRSILLGARGRQVTHQLLSGNDYTQYAEDEGTADIFQSIATTMVAANQTQTVEEFIEEQNKDLEVGLDYSNRDLNKLIADQVNNSATAKWLKDNGYDKLNDKKTKEAYEKMYGEGSSEGKSDKEMRKRISDQILQEQYASERSELTGKQIDAIQGIISGMGKENAQAFSDAFTSAYTSEEGLKSFDFSGLLKNVSFEKLTDLKLDEGDATAQILALLGLTEEQMTEAFGKEWNNLKASLPNLVQSQIADEEKAFESANNIYGDEESQRKAYIEYAQKRLKMTDDFKDESLDTIKKIVIAEDKAQKARAKGLSDTAASISELEKALDPLSKAYSEWKEKGEFDWGDFADDSSFGKAITAIEGGTDALSEFRAEMMAAQTDAEKQEAWNKLASFIVNNKLKIGDLTKATKEQIDAKREQIKTELEAIGIIIDETDLNVQLAEKVIEGADAEAAYSKEKIDSALANGELSSSIKEITNALQNQGFSANEAASALASYAAETIQAKVNSNQMDLSTAISNMAALASETTLAAGALGAFSTISNKLNNIKTEAQHVQSGLTTASPLGAGMAVANFKAKYGLSAQEILDGAVPDYLAEEFKAELKKYVDSLRTTYTYTPPSTSSKSGSGSDKKDKKEATDKEYEKELTRYYKLDKELEKITDDLEDISNAKEKAYGPKHLKNLDQEIKKTQELINKNKEYIREAERYGRQDMADFNKRAKDLGISASFTSLDQVANRYEDYEAKGKTIGERITANFNAAQKAAVDRYNASSKDTDASERYDKDIKAAEDAYDKQMKLLEEYYNFLQKLDEDAAKRREKQRENAEKELENREKRIEIIKYKVELVTNAAEARDAYLEWQKELAVYQEKNRVNIELGIDTAKFSNALKDLKSYEQQFKDILTEAGVGNYSVENWLNGQISATDLNKLQNQGVIEVINDTVSKIRDNANNLKAAVESMTEDFVEELQRQADALKEYSEKIDFVREAYGGLYSITELSLGALGGKEQQRILMNFLDAETELRKESLSKQSEALQRYNALRQQAEKDYLDAVKSGQQIRIVETKKVLDEITEQYQEAYDTWQDGFEELLNNIFDSFEKKVELIFSSFDKQYNLIKDKFDKTKSLSEDYMDDFQKMYEVNKLNADIQKSINESKNVKNKQELAALQEKINQKAKDQKKLSEYEVQALRKQYELKLAIQKLEDVQNAKSQVRLTRDAEGNFGYMYTADETEVADAQQNLNDKLYEYYKFNTDRVQELSETYLELQSQMEEEIKALSLRSFESDAEYNVAVERIQKFYEAKMKNIQQQMEAALGNNKSLTEEYASSLYALGVSIEELIDNFAETNLADALTITDLQAAFETMNDTLFGEDGLISKIKTEAADAFTTLGEAVKEATSQISGEGGLAEAFDNLQEKLTAEKQEALSGWAKSLLDLIGPDSDTYKKLFGTSGTLISSSVVMGDFIEKLKSLLGGATNAQTGAAGQGQTDYSNIDKGLLSNPKVIAWEALKAIIQSRYKGSIGTIDFARDILRESVGLGHITANDKALFTLFDINGDGKITIDDTRFALRNSVQLDDMPADYLQRVWDAFSKFDTGGYTGSWGSSGKLAMLHEKEIVLNKQDTANLLSSVEALRGISRILDLEALSNQLSNSAKLNATMTLQRNNAVPVQQEVHIEASFPNVSDHNEIELALNNLINETVQYTTQLY